MRLDDSPWVWRRWYRRSRWYSRDTLRNLFGISDSFTFALYFFIYFRYAKNLLNLFSVTLSFYFVFNTFLSIKLTCHSYSSLFYILLLESNVFFCQLSKVHVLITWPVFCDCGHVCADKFLASFLVNFLDPSLSCIFVTFSFVLLRAVFSCHCLKGQA